MHTYHTERMSSLATRKPGKKTDMLIIMNIQYTIRIKAAGEFQILTLWLTGVNLDPISFFHISTQLQCIKTAKTSCIALAQLQKYYKLKIIVQDLVLMDSRVTSPRQEEQYTPIYLQFTRPF